jgi:viroplasmin and RNaseH domain-containing protein
MASRDLGKQYEGRETTHGGVIAFSSGPYERKRFKTKEEAQAWLDEWEWNAIGPQWGTIYELRWQEVEP